MCTSTVPLVFNMFSVAIKWQIENYGSNRLLVEGNSIFGASHDGLRFNYGFMSFSGGTCTCWWHMPLHTTVRNAYDKNSEQQQQDKLHTIHWPLERTTGTLMQTCALGFRTNCVVLGAEAEPSTGRYRRQDQKHAWNNQRGKGIEDGACVRHSVERAGTFNRWMRKHSRSKSRDVMIEARPC